ncbi:MAG: hypothetical protein ACD_43C00071G0002 [uncultured bacterium]|nr:MAG: hypothetical protein ACD_43C00071G0002 [uncultured bacterium]
MNLSIKPITNKADWQIFYEAVAPDSFLQTFAWGEFQTEQIFRLGVYDANNLIGAALVIKIKARRGTYLLCPHGPLLLPQAMTALQALLDAIIELGRTERVDFIRIAPLLPADPKNVAPFTAGGFKRAPIHVHPELSWILDLQVDEETLLKNMRKTTRYCIRKAEKDGVFVRSSTNQTDLEIFWNLYLETAQRQHFTPFSKNYLERELSVFNQSDMVKIFIAEYQGKPIAGAVVVFTAHEAFYHQGASASIANKLNAAYLLQWEAIKLAKLRGCQKYNFWGIGPVDQPNHPWAGLSLFKQGYGGQAYPYVPTQDKALTWRYSINRLIELYRAKQRGYGRSPNA